MDDGNVLEHLKELRKRFIYCIAFFVFMLLASLAFVPQIMDFIFMASENMNLEMNVFGITDSVYLYMKVAGLSGAILTTPFILFQIWMYIKPGLHKSEIKVVRRYLPTTLILFVLGMAFAYFVIIPYYVYFSGMLAEANGLNNVIGAKAYLDFVIRTIWPFGLVFELPILVFILSGVGIINHRILTAIRGYAYIGLMVVSAFLTPPDPLSMGIMLVPLSILYESSIIIAKKNHKRFIVRNLS